MRDNKVPVTIQLLDLRIAEVKSEITTHRLETKAEFAKIDNRFDELNQRFDAKFAEFETRSDAKFAQLEARSDAKFANYIAHFDARFEELRTLNIKTLATVEEQNARNRFALDGYSQVYEKLIEMDSRVERIEKHIYGA